MKSGAKAPDFVAYGLLRAAHSHFSASVRAKHVGLENFCTWYHIHCIMMLSHLEYPIRELFRDNV